MLVGFFILNHEMTRKQTQFYFAEKHGARKTSFYASFCVVRVFRGFKKLCSLVPLLFNFHPELNEI